MVGVREGTQGSVYVCIFRMLTKMHLKESDKMRGWMQNVTEGLEFGSNLISSQCF